MNPEKWQKIKSIFNEAVELAPDEWEYFFRDRNDEDAEVLEEVRKLLLAEQENNFAEPVANLAHVWQEAEEESLTEEYLGKQIGVYQIKREIGHGGMGVVFEALRETEDFSQTVALKLLKKGMDSATMLRRFRHERQILASLEHPNIARLLDGGVSTDGTPFFAMEFVSGKPIDEYCDERNSNTNERLKLFLQVCQAVSFAHSRLVVHRDLKPSNIFVKADGTVKLLDFGIAKILSPEEADAKTQTVTALGMMTPAYASPEQIKGEMVSTASDIYSLGLILFELLTGTAAYNFPSKRPDEMAKIICEIEPPKPSSVVSSQWSVVSEKTQGNEQRTTHNAQTTNPKSKIQNQKSLRGDLDNIILKSLRKEPSRRYASVEQFANDIRRHLDGLPVIARPDTFSYRFEKFIERNRVSVIAGMLTFFVLVAGIAATSWQAVRAKRQQELAEQRFNQVRELANNIVFKYYDEAEKLPNSTVIRQMLVDDSLSYFNSLAADANADDALKSELAKTFLRIGKVQGRPSSPNLGKTADAIINYSKGIELLEPLTEKSADNLLRGDLITAYSDYAVILRQSGNKTESEAALKKSVALAERFSGESPNDENLLTRIAAAYLFLGDTLPVGTGAYDNFTAFDKAIETSEKILQRKPDDLRASNILAVACERKGNVHLVLSDIAREEDKPEDAKRNLDEAKKLFERYIEISNKLVRLYSDQIISHALLASAYSEQSAYLIRSGEYQTALQNLQKAFDFYNNLLLKDDAHVGLKSQVADIEQRFGVVYFRLGETNKAEQKFARAFELMDKAIQIDPNNFDFAKQRYEMKNNYADEFIRLRETAKARQFYEKAFNELFEIAKAKDADFASSARAVYFEKLGDCFVAENSTKNAAEEFQKAAAVWNESNASDLKGVNQELKIAILEKKINRLKQT